MKTLELMYHMFFGGITPLAPSPPPRGAPWQGLGVPKNENEDHY